MLQSFRDKIRGVTAGILVTLISIPFVFFGVDALFISGDSVERAAKVNDEPITQLRVQQAVALQRQRLQDQYEDLDPSLIDDDMLRGPVMESVVRQLVIAQAAREQGMAIPQQTFRQMVVNSPAFQREGRFDPSLYEISLNRMGYTQSSYRKLVTEEMLSSQFAQGILSSGFVPEAELEQLAAVVRQKRRFHYLILPTATSTDNLDVSEEEIAAYYEKNAERFRQPESVVLEYIRLSAESLRDKVDVSEEDMRREFERRMASREADVQWHIAHILIEERPDDSHDALVDQIREKLDGGEDFADLAREYSDDAGSAGQGGDLGRLSPGMLPGEMEAAIEDMAPGDISQPVATDSGVHIVKLLDRTDAGDGPAFEDERDRIRAELERRGAREKLPATLEDLKDMAFNADNLQAVADRLDLEARRSAPITRDGGPGIGEIGQVVRAAFSEEVLEDGYASEVMELSDGDFMVVMVDERIPAHITPLEDVRDTVAERVRAEKAAAAARARADELLARVRDGEAVAEVAREAGLEWQVGLDITRFDGGHDPRLTGAVFDIPQSRDLPASDRVQGRDGRYYVFSLNEIRPGDWSEMSSQERRNLRDSLVRMSTGREWRAYEEGLRARADVSIKN